MMMENMQFLRMICCKFSDFAEFVPMYLHPHFCKKISKWKIVKLKCDVKFRLRLDTLIFPKWATTQCLKIAQKVH